MKGETAGAPDDVKITDGADFTFHFSLLTGGPHAARFNVSLKLSRLAALGLTSQKRGSASR
jgi:hypothetical protein